MYSRAESTCGVLWGANQTVCILGQKSHVTYSRAENTSGVFLGRKVNLMYSRAESTYGVF